MHCLCKQQEVIDLMENESVDLLMVDETHFKKVSNIDLTAFSNYSPIFIERDFGVKQGPPPCFYVRTELRPLNGPHLWKIMNG